MQQNLLRLKREMERFKSSTLPGVSCWQTDVVDELRANIVGPDGTPYEDGVFEILIKIPERYPFVPPTVRVLTPVYHPNIDDGGRICLDTLKLPPQGSWKPCLNLTSILMSIQLLLAEPNFNDALMSDIASEYQRNKENYIKTAREWTNKHARKNSTVFFASAFQQDSGNSNTCKRSPPSSGNEPNTKRLCREQ